MREKKWDILSPFLEIHFNKNKTHKICLFNYLGMEMAVGLLILLMNYDLFLLICLQHRSLLN